MLRRIVLIAIIAGGYTGAMYTSTGCAGQSPTAPTEQELYGKVSNAVTAGSVAGASLTLSRGGSSLVTTSDSNGMFRFLAPVGDNRLDVTAAGYQPYLTTVTVRTSPTGINVLLQPAK